MFRNIYKGKTVLVTGHTGFKGSWLTAWLLELGAKVIGFSLDIPTQPSNFEAINLKDKITHLTGDVRDLAGLVDAFGNTSPEIVFHLAAQALTRRSYDMPQETFFTNVGGTVNVLESIRRTKPVKAAVLITSDKCYKNVEWIWGYRENDKLGGDDPYSASKACAEIVCNSYMKSFFPRERFPMISSARAGNVIGGGDWAADRIVPDCVRAFSKGERLEVRSPIATRPWQHVLEPLSGYLWLGANLLGGNVKASGESFNFGPSDSVNTTVEELIKSFVRVWGIGEWYIADPDAKKKESTLLKLNCDKAMNFLNWHAVLSFEETVEMTAEWYRAFYGGEKDMYGFTAKQIRRYADIAEMHGLPWADSAVD